MGDEGDVGTVLGAGGWGRPADQSQATRGRRWRQGGAGGSLAVVVQNGGAAAEWQAVVLSTGGGEQDLAAVLEVVYGCAPVRRGDIHLQVPEYV